MYNGFSVGNGGQTQANGSQDDFLRKLIAFLRDSGYTSLDTLLQQILTGITPGGGGNGGGGNGGGNNGGGGGGGFCLAGDVPVLMADGSAKPASEIRVHDLIMGFDPGIGNVPQEVFTTNSASQRCMTIAFEGGAIDASTTHNWFVVQGDHMAVVPTMRLQPGMQLIGEDQKPREIQSISEAGQKVVFWWNCVPNQCYYAGGVLHHNAYDPFGVIPAITDGPLPGPGLTTRKEVTTGTQSGGSS